MRSALMSYLPCVCPLVSLLACGRLELEHALLLGRFSNSDATWPSRGFFRLSNGSGMGSSLSLSLSASSVGRRRFLACAALGALVSPGPCAVALSPLAAAPPPAQIHGLSFAARAAAICPCIRVPAQSHSHTWMPPQCASRQGHSIMHMRKQSCRAQPL